VRQQARDLLSFLPVELLYEIQFCAVSDSLPIVCRRLYYIFQSAPPTIKADYLLGRCLAHLSKYPHYSIISFALRYPLCRTLDVLEAFLKRSAAYQSNVKFAIRLPRWLFRRLGPSGEEALPLLRYLYGLRSPSLCLIPDSHRGFPLASAVKAGAIPLVRFLLELGASPYCENALAVRLAIKRRDLDLVRLLINHSALEEVKVDSNMLKLAVNVGARHIAEFLVNERGCVPDLEIISLLGKKELDRHYYTA